MRANYKPVDPDKQRREMQREFKNFHKQEPGLERAQRLAEFTREAHDERQLNMAMHTAALCLEDDPDAPALLVAAYDVEDDDMEARLRSWTDLADLARYIDRPDLVELARERLEADAEAWYRQASDADQRVVLRTLASVVDRAFADGIKDRVKFG